MNPSHPSAPAVPPENHVVDFNAYVAGRYNRDFGGKGTLSIHAEEPRFRFHARPRGRLLLHKQPVELAFRSDQIWNVRAHDDGVQFSTAVGKSGRKNQPFVFTCANAEAAAALVRQLPPTQDAEFVAGEDFAAKLRRVPDAPGGVRSVTNLLLAANIAAFIAMGVAGAGWFDVDSMLPFIRYGANNGAATTAGEWWRLVTCMFLHFGLVHLGLNLWALLQVGHFVEKLLGRALFTAMYFGSGISASLTSLLWNGDKVWSAGASGAVFGVYGALLGYLVRQKQGVPRSVFQPMLKSTLTFAGYNLLYGLAHPLIDNAAHIGGFGAGIVLGWVCAVPLEPDERARLFARRLGAGLVYLGLALAVGVTAAPRFDYKISEELRWKEANDHPVAREPGLLERQSALFNAYGKEKDHTALTAWAAELAGFYEEWRAKIDALQLDPALQTARRRERFSNVLRLKTESLRQLGRDVAGNDPKAIERFLEADRDTTAKIRTVNEPK